MLNSKILLFGGTTEAKDIAGALLEKGIEFTLSVATDYGKEMAKGVPNIFSGRLNEKEIAKLLTEYNLVIDATHPYAFMVTENIKKACAGTNTKYLRVLRPPSSTANTQGVLYFANNQEAVQYLNTKEGNILLTTGSKDAADFTGIKDYAGRVFIRMLPMADGLQKCLDLGFKNSHLICMQGKFSKELNVEILKMLNAKYLVTKDSGESGGFLNKLAASSAAGAETLIISRPRNEDGLTLSQMLALLENYRNGDGLN